MTLASLVLVIIRDIRGQILQPLISRMTRIMFRRGTEGGPHEAGWLPLTHSRCANRTAGSGKTYFTMPKQIKPTGRSPYLLMGVLQTAVGTHAG